MPATEAKNKIEFAPGLSWDEYMADLLDAVHELDSTRDLSSVGAALLKTAACICVGFDLPEVQWDNACLMAYEQMKEVRDEAFGQA